MKKQTSTIIFRAPEDERIEWEKDAERRSLKFSKWLREACRAFFNPAPGKEGEP